MFLFASVPWHMLPQKKNFFLSSMKCGKVCLSPQQPRTGCHILGVSLWPIWLSHWTLSYKWALISNEEDISAPICYSLVLYLNLFTPQSGKKVRDSGRQLTVKERSAHQFILIYQFQILWNLWISNVSEKKDSGRNKVVSSEKKK